MRCVRLRSAALIGGALELALAAAVLAQGAPLDLWAPVRSKIRDRGTLNLQAAPQPGYWDVFFDSEIGDAKWADSGPPYEVHSGATIRIHGYLAAPAAGGPYPAIVIGHGHGGQGSPELARAVAAFGYVALAIDGPQAGLSTGGPQDTEQAWISVEEAINVPSPEVSYLYHYAYAGMRAITALDQLSRVPSNPFRIDRTRFGVLGASMGGQFTYYVNGVDDRVKAAVAIAVAGDWDRVVLYRGAWLYHGLYYYTRDGIPSGQDALNTVSDACRDPTMRTFVDYFDPAAYAATQHGPLLTIIGTHDQYFTAPAVNATYDRVASAGASPRFIKRIMLSANGKHGVVDNDDGVRTILSVIGDAAGWLSYAFADGPTPPETPTVSMTPLGDTMVFRVSAPEGSNPIRRVDLSFATQMDSTVPVACDFTSLRLIRLGGSYFGFVPVGALPPCGPAARPGNVLYFASVKDWGPYTVTSKLYRGSGEMEFGDDFLPQIEHFPRDTFPVPPPPDCAGSALGDLLGRAPELRPEAARLGLTPPP